MSRLATEPVFSRDGDLYAPSGHARGPWDPQAQHGGAPAALLARAAEALVPEMLLARMTVEFMGAVPLVPLAVEAQVVRAGRRLQVVEAAIHADGREACRARAVLLRRGEGPERVHAAPLPGPEGGRTVPWFSAGDGAGDEAFHRSAMEIRFVGGGDGPGPAQVWFRLRRPLVEGETPSPAQRALAAGDFGNGVARELDFSKHLFVNTDLSVHLHREPQGEWIGLDAQTTLGPQGVGLASSVLHDEHGPAGQAAQTLFVAPR